MPSQSDRMAFKIKKGMNTIYVDRGRNMNTFRPQHRYMWTRWGRNVRTGSCSVHRSSAVGHTAANVSVTVGSDEWLRNVCHRLCGLTGLW